MPRTNVYILLTPNALDAAVINGSTVVRSERVELDPAQWAAAWDDGLVALDAALASVLRRLRAADRSGVTVVTDTPTGLVDASAAPGVGAQAELAAAAALRERVVDNAPDKRTAPVLAAVIGSGGSSRADVPSAPGVAGPSSVVLAATDHEQTLQKVDGWVRRGGGQLQGLRPARSVLLHAVMRRIDEAKDAGSAWCYLGENTSAIGGRPEGTSPFLRSIDIGLRALAEPFARVEKRRAEHGQAPGPDGVAPVIGEAELFGRVLSQLIADGFPARGRGAEGDPRAAALPLLAPVLQRLTIEIKQTLRYATGPGAKPIGRIVLTGPGAAVPGLAQALKDSLQLTVDVDESAACEEAGRSFGSCTTGASALRLRGGEILLVPTSARVLQRQQARTRTLRAGVLAAAIVLGGEYLWVKRAQASVQRQISAQAGEVDAIRARRDAVQQAAAMAADLNNAAFETCAAIGARAEWYAALAELSAAVGERVELVELRLAYEGEKPLISLAGFAIDAAQATPEGARVDVLGEFVQRVQASPLVKRVTIGSTSAAERGGRTARRFAVQIELVAFPPQHAFADLPAGRRMEVTAVKGPDVDIPARTGGSKRP